MTMFKHEAPKERGCAPIAQTGREFGDSHPGFDGDHLRFTAESVLSGGVDVVLPTDPQALAELNARVLASLSKVRVAAGDRVA